MNIIKNSLECMTSFPRRGILIARSISRTSKAISAASIRIMSFKPMLKNSLSEAVVP
jgi:hypothetical protein